MADHTLQQALERQLGSLLFQMTALQVQLEQAQAENLAKSKEIQALKLALDVLQKPNEGA